MPGNVGDALQPIRLSLPVRALPQIEAYPA
jgi:hypothetical protein